MKYFSVISRGCGFGVAGVLVNQNLRVLPSPMPRFARFAQEIRLKKKGELLRDGG